MRSLRMLLASFFLTMVSAHAVAGQTGNLPRGVDPRKLPTPVPARSVSAPPFSITISSPPDEGASTTQPFVTFTITGTRPATICWKLDGGAQTCSAQAVTSFQAVLNALSFTSHVLDVTATDATGSAVTKRRSWTVTS